MVDRSPALKQLLVSRQVTDSWFAGIQDTDDDAGNLPDVVSVTGNVKFTPTLVGPLLFVSVPATFSVVAVTGSYDSDGNLALNESEFVRMWTTDNAYASTLNWQWHAEFSGITVNGVPLTRSPFNFALPAATAALDLATVSPVAASNGVAVTQGPQGAAGTGLIIRGIITGTGSSVLPAGFGAAQNGYTYRVRSSNGTYDELWAWLWNGVAGIWTDSGPVPVGASIDDANPYSALTTYSAVEIETRLNAVLAQAEAYTDTATSVAVNEGAMVERRQNLDLSWPLRNAPADACVVWVGTSFPPTSTGYAVPAQDSFEGVASLT